MKPTSMMPSRTTHQMTKSTGELQEQIRRRACQLYEQRRRGNRHELDDWLQAESKHLKKIEDEISAWPTISVHPHRFGGKEFLFGSGAEVGHIHTRGIVDIPFPRAVRNALLAAGLAEQHHWVPNSGWVTFHLRNGNDEDLGHALWLMRLSYIRYALKTATDSRGMLEQESEELHLTSQFKALLERFVPDTANHSATEPLSAA
jgi:hypothetical protein